MKTKSILQAFLIFTFSILIFNSSSAQMFWNQACRFTGSPNSYIAVPNSAQLILQEALLLKPG